MYELAIDNIFEYFVNNLVQNIRAYIKPISIWHQIDYGIITIP